MALLSQPVMTRKRRLPCAVDIAKIVEGYEDLYCDGSTAVCRCCKERLLIRRRHQCERHINSQVHKENKDRQFPLSKFIMDLLWLLWLLKIPLRILDTSSFRRFWAKYVPAYPLPHRSTLHRKYIPGFNNDIRNKVMQRLQGQKIWVTVGDFTDAADNTVTNILVRTLRPDGSSQPFLLCSKQSPQTDAKRIVQLVIDTLAKFQIEKENVIMLVTDGSKYMHSAGQDLKEHYKNLMHVTCLRRALDTVAVEVQRRFPNADTFVDGMTKIFAKSGNRINAMDDFLCPKPMLTGCAIWLKIAHGYSEYFDEIKELLESLNPKESRNVFRCRQLIQMETLLTELEIINSQYYIIVDGVSDLEFSTLLLSESLAAVQRVSDHLSRFKDPIGQAIQEKLKKLLAANPGYSTISDIGIHGRAAEQCLTCAPLTCLDVEKSFTTYKEICKDRQRNLSAETIEHMLMTAFYAIALDAEMPLRIH